MFNWLFKTDKYWQKKCERLEKELKTAKERIHYIENEWTRYEDGFREGQEQAKNVYDRYIVNIEESLKVANTSIDILLKSKEIIRMKDL